MVVAIVDCLYKNRKPRMYNLAAPTLRSERIGLLVMEYEQIGLELGETQEEKGGTELPPNIRIRKLTPKECYRLMGFDDASFDRAEKVNSNSQLYKQAGNSIVVSVLEAIMGQFFEGKEHHWERWLSEKAYESRDNQASD